MGIYFSVKKRKKGKDYLFVDELSADTYENALFRLSFISDTLKKEHFEIIDEYLQNSSKNLVELLNGSNTNTTENISHEDRIQALENEIATLTNALNTQTPIHGTLKITPITMSMDFNKDGTMIKFMNVDNGIYTTGILKDGVESEIVLPVGAYTVNIVNALNDNKDGVFTQAWENATSNDNNHTLTYTVVEGITEISTRIEYESDGA